MANKIRTFGQLVDRIKDKIIGFGLRMEFVNLIVEISLDREINSFMIRKPIILCLILDRRAHV